jgi:hypothetical protein
MQNMMLLNVCFCLVLPLSICIHHPGARNAAVLITYSTNTGLLLETVVGFQSNCVTAQSTGHAVVILLIIQLDQRQSQDLPINLDFASVLA